MNSSCRLQKFFYVRVCYSIAVAVVCGCNSGQPIPSPNNNVYKTVAEKWDKDFGGRPDSMIDFDAGPRGDLAIEELIGQNGVLSLPDAVTFATGHSSLQQEEKDSLALQGLDLIQARYHLSALTGKSGAAAVTEGSGKTMSNTIASTAELAEAWSAVLTEALRTGTIPELSSSLAEPLHKKIRWEDNITERRLQLEREALYQVRSFHHFRKKFAVWITIGYYRVLQGQDAVQAALDHYKALEETCEKTGKMLETGQIQKSELDRAYQEKSQAWERYLDTRGNYEQLLDQFKLESGIPIRTEIHLDENELEALRNRNESERAVFREETVENVLENRLDLANLGDKLTDQLRKIFQIAYNSQGRLNVINYRRKASPEPIEYATLEYLENQFMLDFDEKLPFDLLCEQNEFRKDIMKLSLRHRDYGEKVNKIIADVREAYRDWEKGTERYRLQLESRKLAEKRVKDGLALLSFGRTNIGDVLKARNDLYEAQIRATDALVDSEIAILQMQVQPDSTWRKWDWKN